MHHACPHTDLPTVQSWGPHLASIPSIVSHRACLVRYRSPSHPASRCTARRRSPANIMPMPPRPPPRSAALPARKSTVASSERGVARHPCAYPSSSSSGARLPWNVTRDARPSDAACARAGYWGGEPALGAASYNGWVTPSVLEYEPDELRLVFVLRDDRGGVTWTRRTVRLVDPEAEAQP